MPRSRRFSDTSVLRHRAKMERLFLGYITEETGRELARAVSGRWREKFLPFREAYNKLIGILEKNDVPPGLYGLYRSFLLKALANIPVGTATPDELIREFVDHCGLDPAVLGDILDQFDLREKAPEEHTPKKKT